MLLNRNGTFVGTPEGAFMRFIGAKNARYTCAMASTRNSCLRGAAPGSVGVACDEAILPSIAKRRGKAFAAKKREGRRTRHSQRPAVCCRSPATRRGRCALRLNRQQQSACLGLDAQAKSREGCRSDRSSAMRQVAHSAEAAQKAAR